MNASDNHITQLLEQWRQGNALALEQLMPLVYGELHRLAQCYMADERPGHTLQATALLNEAFLRLLGTKTTWENRVHFYGLCAHTMRRILVDWARARSAQKRGGGAAVELGYDAAALAASQSGTDLVQLDDALQALTNLDPRKGRVVELRFFGGLSVEETAEVLHVSLETVHRDWKLAKSWLRRELNGRKPDGA